MKKKLFLLLFISAFAFSINAKNEPKQLRVIIISVVLNFIMQKNTMRQKHGLRKKFPNLLRMAMLIYIYL